MKLIVGLGNPGGKYVGTRHNVGFETLAELGRNYGSGGVRQKFQGEMRDARIGDEKVLLLSPLTYMNNSGNCVQPVRDFYKISHEDILVICDDFNLPLAKLRVRRGGSAGGQKGLQDILRRLGVNRQSQGRGGNEAAGADDRKLKQGEIARLRIGIGPPPEHFNIADYVLSKFSPAEAAETKLVIARAAAAAADWVKEGVGYCMNRYNADPTDQNTKKQNQTKNHLDGGE